MKVLVATERGQGAKPDDYSWTTEGELVRLADCPDRYCRCTGFSGVESHRVTSTALVVEREDLTPELLVDIFERNWIAGGWGEYLTPAEVRELAEEDVLTLMCHLDELPPGTIVGRTGWCGGVEVRVAA
jgi:hypothetical protein